MSEKTVALTKQKCPCYKHQPHTKSPTLIKSRNSPFLQHFTTAKPHKPLIHCQTVNQNNNFNSSSHTDNLSEGFTGMSEIAVWETEERSSSPREIGVSWLFTTRFSNQEVQSRRPAQRNCLFVLSLCLGWGTSEGHPGIPGCPSVVPGTSSLQRLFLFFGKSLFWSAMQGITGQLHEYIPTVTASAPL